MLVGQNNLETLVRELYRLWKGVSAEMVHESDQKICPPKLSRSKHISACRYMFFIIYKSLQLSNSNSKIRKGKDDLKNENDLKNEDDLKKIIPLHLREYYLKFFLMTSHLNSHRTTNIKPEMLSGVQTGNGTPHYKYNIRSIAHARQWRTRVSVSY